MMGDKEGDPESRAPRDSIEDTGTMTKVTEKESYSGYLQIQTTEDLSGATKFTMS